MKLAIRQVLGARKCSVGLSYRIVFFVALNMLPIECNRLKLLITLNDRHRL